MSVVLEAAIKEMETQRNLIGARAARLAAENAGLTERIADLEARLHAAATKASDEALKAEW